MTLYVLSIIKKSSLTEMTEVFNISSNKLLHILSKTTLDITENIDDSGVKELLKPLEELGIVTDKYRIIIENMDDLQIKNVYIYMYTRWKNTKENYNNDIEMIPEYNSSIHRWEMLQNNIGDDPVRLIFFINSIQLYFLPSLN